MSCRLFVSYLPSPETGSGYSTTYNPLLNGSLGISWHHRDMDTKQCMYNNCLIAVWDRTSLQVLETCFHRWYHGNSPEGLVSTKPLVSALPKASSNSAGAAEKSQQRMLLKKKHFRTALLNSSEWRRETAPQTFHFIPPPTPL